MEDLSKAAEISPVVPPPRKDGKKKAASPTRAFAKIRSAMLDESGTTAEVSEEESDDENDDVGGGTIKIAAYTGGSRAEGWFDVIISKLSD